MRKKFVALLLLMLTLGVISGCTGDTLTGDNSFGDQPTGNLVLSIVDAPGDYEEVYINIVKAFVKPTEGESDKEWIMLGDYTDAPIGINLLDYRIQELNLPATDIPAGSYEEIRLVLDHTGYVTFEGDATQYPLTVGELEETEDGEEDKDDEDEEEEDQKDVLGDDEQAIDIEYPFFITESAMTAIQIDFNVAEMVKPNKETVEDDYILDTEEVKAIDKAEAGEIEGKVGVLDVETGEIAKVATKVTVNLYDATDTTYSEPLATTWPIEEEMEDEDEEDKKAEPGKFKIRGIAAGNYTLVMEAEGYQRVEITNLVIEDGNEIEFEGKDEEEDEEDDQKDEENDEDTPSYTIIGAQLIEEYIILEPVQ